MMDANDQPIQRPRIPNLPTFLLFYRRRITPEEQNPPIMSEAAYHEMNGYEPSLYPKDGYAKYVEGMQRRIAYLKTCTQTVQHVPATRHTFAEVCARVEAEPGFVAWIQN